MRTFSSKLSSCQKRLISFFLSFSLSLFGGCCFRPQLLLPRQQSAVEEVARPVFQRKVVASSAALRLPWKSREARTSLQRITCQWRKLQYRVDSITVVVAAASEVEELSASKVVFKLMSRSCATAVKSLPVVFSLRHVNPLCCALPEAAAAERLSCSSISVVTASVHARASTRALSLSLRCCACYVFPFSHLSRVA
jgi:hypothetical protein